ncbi:NAD(+) diphosphatase [Gordonia rubripertincta]|uniref:NAD(+) diphosphatase n=1 Tax=Gordonia rubripertincta TaxID=36822 RepID=UPI000B8D8ECC|nr:NAD(+) diphosphatase [Gordonia rubripertincta]ASR04399.1 NADH pyrophosphatase [Gordonia rubripertincta]
MHFELVHQPLLSRATFHRADEIRDDAERMLAGWPQAKVLLIDSNGRYPVGESGVLHWVPAATVADEPPADAVILGVVDGVDRWARRVDHIDGPTDDARRGAVHLTPDEAGLLVTALGILNWHETARHSPVDGSVTQSARGGWVRRSIQSGRDEFPRTDPAIITVVHDGADRILLGRQAVWPDGWYSTLAGFVEPGESLEQCVLREVHEEVGIVVREPRYLGSQPWPFPRSLMLGFAAIGDPADQLAFLDGEIGDAQWFHRDEVREALSRDGWTRADPGPDGETPRLQLPGSISIARTLIESWAAAG